MRIEVSKSELAGALAALGKLVSRTSPVEAFRSVEIEGKENKIVLRTANTDEFIAFRMAVEVSEPFQLLVNFDDFRTVVRCSRNKVLGITLENGQFAVDGLAMRIVTDPLPPLPQPGNDCTRLNCRPASSIFWRPPRKTPERKRKRSAMRWEPNWANL